MKTILILTILSSVAFASKKVSPSPTASPEPKSNPQYIESVKTKIMTIQGTCGEDKPICRRELLELRSTIQDGKDERVLLKQIDETLKKYGTKVGGRMGSKKKAKAKTVASPTPIPSPVVKASPTSTPKK